MGDAAHAMMPFHAQGVAQSIEDSWVLTRCLEEATEGEVPAALKRYEALRLTGANRVQQQSRAAEHLFYMTEPDEIARHEVSSQEGFPPGQQLLFSYDAEKAVCGDDAEWRAMSW
jgi:salicylate hydroxylase